MRPAGSPLRLALVSRAKGYPVLLLIPDKMSSEKVLHLKALGAHGPIHSFEPKSSESRVSSFLAMRMRDERSGT